jgi:hypothetical protein
MSAHAEDVAHGCREDLGPLLQGRARGHPGKVQAAGDHGENPERLFCAGVVGAVELFADGAETARVDDVAQFRVFESAAVERNRDFFDLEGLELKSE